MTSMTDWRSSAACLTHDPELFAPEGWGSAHAPQITRAKAICSGCLVRDVCLGAALAEEVGLVGRGRYLIRGGLTGPERAGLDPTAGDSVEPTPDERCGTYKGYAAHRRRGEQSCRECLDANTDYRATWKAGRA